MPKRTNPFQRLVTLLEKAFRPEGEATVSQSKELPDRVTGELREVDIVVELTDAGDRITVGIEVTGGGKPRRATVEWVERMSGKHQDLPTDKLVLVAKGGFTKAAKEKAKFLGISTYTLEEADQTDWPNALRGFSGLRVVSFLMPVLEKVLVILPDTVPRDTDTSGLKDSVFVDTNGRELSSLINEVQGWIHQPNAIEIAMEHAPTEEGKDLMMRAEVPIKPDAFLRLPSGKTLPVHAIKFLARCRKREQTVPMTHHRYRGTSVVVGSVTDTDVFGGELNFAVVDKEGGAGVAVSVEIKRTAKDG